MSFQDVNAFTGECVPNDDHVVVAAGNDPAAVELNAANGSAMTREDAKLEAGLEVPETYRAISRPRNDPEVLT